MTNLLLKIMLLLLVPSVQSANPIGDGRRSRRFLKATPYSGRRALADADLESATSFAQSACMDAVFPSQCNDELQDFNLDQHVAQLQQVGDDFAAVEAWSAKVVSVYCCKLRSGNQADLTSMTFDFPKMCFESHVQSVLQNVGSDASDENSGLFWTLTVMDFCPNIAIPETARRPSHFHDLYRVAISTDKATPDQLKEQAVHDCAAGISNGEDLVDLTILFPEAQDGDYQHIVAFWGDELTAESYIDWNPRMSFTAFWTLATQAEYTLLNGIDGYFRTPVKMDISQGIRVSGLSKKNMVEKMQSIQAGGRYDFMFNNCAHQVSRIAKAGLGCEIREIPFLLPGALAVVGEEIGQALTAEELATVQDRLNEIGVDETFTLSRLMRRALVTARSFLNR